MTRLPLRLLSRQLRLPMPIWRWNFGQSWRILVCAICGRKVARKFVGVHLSVWHEGEGKANTKKTENNA